MEIVQKSALETNHKEFERVYGDAWDSAKASGSLSLLTNEEYRLLSRVYLHLRSVNDWVGDIWRLRVEKKIGGADVDKDMDYYRSRIWLFKDEILERVKDAQNHLQSVNRETNRKA